MLYFNILFKPFKNNPGAFYYWPFLMMKNFIILTMMAFVPDPIIQSLVNLSVVGLFLFYVISRRPFRKFSNNMIAIICEGFIFWMYFLTVMIVISYKTVHHNRLGRLMLASVWLFCFAFFAYVVIRTALLISNLFGFYRSRVPIGEEVDEEIGT